MESRQRPIYRLVYNSIVMLPIGRRGQQGIRDILGVARARNVSLGITGVLHCDGDFFVQVLEGRRRAVEAVMASVLRDPRHTDVQIIERGPHPQRDFAGMSMALVTGAELDRAWAREPEMLDFHGDHGAGVVALMTRALAPRLA